MMKIRKVLSGGERGFTLIELLVVIAVLGILAAIAIPRLGGVTDRARMSEASAAMGSFKTALEIYNVENGYYPEGGNDNVYAADDADAEVEFRAMAAEFIDNVEGENYKGNLEWLIEYTNDGDDLTVTLTSGDYVATMERSAGSYGDVQLRQTN